MLVSRFDGSSFGELRKTTQGGVIVPAALTRTGVFTYRRDDGTIVRELRHPDEVYKPESLATLRSATVTIGHPPDGVHPDNYSARTVGHVDDAGKPEDGFITADVRVLDRKALRGIESKALQEVSCGYGCRVDMTAGVYNGEAYDGIQRDITYNHVALLPKGMGRAGSDVKLRLDSVGNEVPETATLLSQSEANNIMTAEQIKALQDERDALKARADAAESKLADKTEAEKAAAQVELLKADKAALQVKLDAAADPKAIDAKVAARVALVTSARLVLDSKDAPYVAEGKSDHAVRVEVLARLSPSFKCDGKSEAAVEGAYEMALETSATARAATAAVQVASPAGHRADGTAAVPNAYERNIANSLKAHESSPTRISAK